MAKQSGYLQKLAAQQAVRDEKTRRFTLQQCKDMMLITMHEDFGWGEERLKKLSDCYDQTFMTSMRKCALRMQRPTSRYGSRRARWTSA